MAWNPSPKVADCREIARKWGKQQVIVLAVDPVAGTLEMATYGQTRELCAEAKRLGDHAYQAVMDHYEDDVLPGARLYPANHDVAALRAYRRAWERLPPSVRDGMIDAMRCWSPADWNAISRDQANASIERPQKPQEGRLT